MSEITVDAPELVDEPLDEAEARQPVDPRVAEKRRNALGHIRQFGDPVLKTKARDVELFDEALHHQIARMEVLMDDALGVGLAAPQIGIVNRVLVYRPQSEAPLGVLVNPRIEFASKEKEPGEEGCLSLPDVHIDVDRHVFVRVAALDGSGEPITVEASGFEARIIQHEMDHLDGVLILDRASREQRKAAMQALREAQSAVSA